MSGTSISLGGFSIGASALLITAGILACFLMSLLLYGKRNHCVYPVVIFAPIAFLFAVLFARLTHWYFNSESYASFASAFLEFDVGSFTIPGMLLGVWLGALLTEKLGACEDRWAILDAAAPGLLFLLACIRFSAWFNSSCRGRINVDIGIFKILPFAIASTDNAGNVTYKFATFFMEGVLLLVLFVVACVFWKNHIRDKMYAPCSRSGNVARMALIVYGALEVIMDSTRFDSPLMRFKFISYLNQYSAFISFAQVFSAITMLLVLIYYSARGIKARGFRWYYPLIWAGFLGGVFMVGFLGEYKVQRYAAYLQCYSFMLVGLILMVVMIYLAYRRCVRRSIAYGSSRERD